MISRNVWLSGLAWSTDPVELPNTIAHEEAHHRYGGNDPVNRTDRSGLSPCTDVEIRQMREIGASESLIQLICGATKLPGISAFGRPSSASPYGPGASMLAALYRNSAAPSVTFALQA